MRRRASWLAAEAALALGTAGIVIVLACAALHAKAKGWADQ